MADVTPLLSAGLYGTALVLLENARDAIDVQLAKICLAEADEAPVAS